MRYVNLGCGVRFHPDWLNFDVAPRAPGVTACDLSRGVPLPDGGCDAVYHSHLLEHLRPGDALPFLRECHRILRRGGILRVVVPDLEQACREYLRQLDAARAGAPGAADNHRWMTVELLDQLARERSGGTMLGYLRQNPLPNAAYVRARIGNVAGEGAADVPAPGPMLRFAAGLRAAYERLVCAFLFRHQAAQALAIGRFRLSGEAHQWMYDGASLAALLRAAGFEAPAPRAAGESAIDGWARFGLDLNADGSVARPESLFMEAVKPA